MCRSQAIGQYAFYCSGLTEITIPESVTEIGSCAFEGCSSLTSVVIPEGITEIKEETFKDCSSLTSVEIPGSVKEIKMWAFKDCPDLTIHAPAESAAEKYAKEKEIPFKAK